MVCPNCGWSEGNAVAKKQQSDKDYYLEFWGYTLGTPEAEEGAVQPALPAGDGPAREHLSCAHRAPRDRARQDHRAPEAGRHRVRRCQEGAGEGPGEEEVTISKTFET